jgi:hypothetical protein
MAADPLNSVGGYSVSIPPVQVIDFTGNVTTQHIQVTNIDVSSNLVVSGTCIAQNFVGDLVGNVSSGGIIAPGYNSQVLYNDNGKIEGTGVLTIDTSTDKVTITGELLANALTIGSTEDNQFCTTRVLLATTVSNAPDQNLHRTPADSICSIDYTIIASDNTSNTRQTSKLFASVLGSEVGYFEYGTIDVPVTSPGVGDFKVVYSGGNVVLTVSPIPNSLVNYKIMITSYKA